MKAAVMATCLALFVAGGVLVTRAQEPAAGDTASTATTGVRPSETRVPLAQPAAALDAAGREALSARLRTQALSGTPEAPARNTRIVIENRSTIFYNYVTGWATFYDAEGVRCGEGLWKLEAFAPQESVEVDTPGLRLTCTPATWRIVATNLLTRAGDVAKPGQPAPRQAEESIQQSNALSSGVTSPAGGATDAGATAATSSAPAASIPPLEININGKTIPLQLGNPLEISVGRERVRIVVQPAP